MGAQAGVLWFDHRPVQRDRATLVSALQSFAPDGVSIATADGLAMAYGLADTWTSDRWQPQPVRSDSGLVMTWDGRLDNRADLAIRVGAVAHETSDAALALAIVERDGLDGLGALIGDWSLVVWDGRRRTLSFARDYMGVRPLYYCRDDRAVMWSSDLGELAIRAGRADDLDEAFAAWFMALRFSGHLTPYRGIHVVPTATWLRFGADGSETRQRFWSLQPEVVRYRDPRMYEERLRDLWYDAVAARLRTSGTVWAELSGGLDSSSVVCMADALIKNRAVTATGVQPLSHVTLGSPEGDERRFIAEVEAQIGVRTQIVGIEEHLEASDDASDWITPCGSRGVGLASVRRVRDGGGRVILSGRVGDVVMGCTFDNSVAVLDDVGDRRWREALAKIRLWSRGCRVPYIAIVRSLVREMVDARSPSIDPPLNDVQREGIALLAPRLRAIAEADDAGDAVPIAVRPSQRRRANVLARYSRDALLAIPVQPPGIVYTYPYVHRPLVEFVLGIPGEQLSAPGATRSLMRRAFGGLVPAPILRRVSKGYYPPVAMRAIRSVAASLPPVQDLEVVQRGWIEAGGLDAAIRGLAAGGHTGAELDRVLRLERWLIARHRRAPAAIPNRKEVTDHAVRIA
jgi:asparagine synthase (glutamine-hydrolysing)